MIINELIRCAAFHFDYEERLMEAAEYPELEAHRRVHQDFVNWVDNLREEFTCHRRKPLGMRIMGFLRERLSQHIPGDDRFYRSCIGGFE